MVKVYGNYLKNENVLNSIKKCLFFNNTSQAGGSIYLYFPGSLEIADCIFHYNQALLGAAIYFEQKSCFFLKKKYKS